MPILYKNNQITHMKTIQEMPQIDAQDFIKIKQIEPTVGYTEVQSNRMVQLIKTYIDPRQASCAYCGSSGGLYEAKNKFIRFYLDNETNIKFISEGISPFAVEVEEPISSVDVAIIASEVINESKPKNKRNKK